MSDPQPGRISRDVADASLLFDKARLPDQGVLDHLHIVVAYALGLPGSAQRPSSSACPKCTPPQVTQESVPPGQASTRVHLGEAKASGTAEYVAHRLQRVRGGARLFTSAMLREAIDAAHAGIDRIATEALRAPEAEGGRPSADRGGRNRAITPALMAVTAFM